MNTAIRTGTHYDVAVLGLGTMGSFAALELVQRGHTVIGFDRYAPPHHHGSHGGDSRVYRLAYPEGSGYVPLARQAGKLWDDIGERLGKKMLHRAGMLHMGDPASGFIAEIAECSRAHDLAIARFSAEEVRRRYPAFQIPDNFVGLFDSHAGWVDTHAALIEAGREAQRLGAVFKLNTEVLAWTAANGSVTVRTENGEYSAARLLVTGGAWASSILQELHLPLTVRRKVLTWFEPLLPPIFPRIFDEGRMPVFAFPDNWTYGFPDIGGRGVKLAEHWGGEDIPGPGGAISPPGAADIDPIRRTISKYMPALGGAPPGDTAKLVRAEVCLYTLTPDEDFILDLHPAHENVVIAAGFSGHGFKFAPLIGRALADLSVDGQTDIDIGFLGLSRFDGASTRAGAMCRPDGTGTTGAVATTPNPLA